MKHLVYTDGACCRNPGPGGWAWVLATPALVVEHEAFGSAEHTTNQRMELTAALMALDSLRSTDYPLEIVSDSAYLVNCFKDRWWVGWLRRDWRTSSDKPVVNRDLWEPLLDRVLDRMNVTFRWVKGHAGDVMNEYVDGLARAAARQQQ